jgi:hypothetical protein
VAPLAQIVDVGDLISVVWTSFLAGIGVCFVFSLAIFGFARAVDSRSRGNGVAAVAYTAMTLVAFALVMAVVVFGVIVMTDR